MVNFALGMGKGIKKGDVVRLSANESAKPLYIAICNAIVDAGGHVLSHYAPDEEKGDTADNVPLHIARTSPRRCVSIWHSIFFTLLTSVKYPQFPTTRYKMQRHPA